MKQVTMHAPHQVLQVVPGDDCMATSTSLNVYLLALPSNQRFLYWAF